MASSEGDTERTDSDDGSRTVGVVIETPKGCRNKFKYDPKEKRFRLDKVLPAGSSFPYDFGYIPGTLAEDGDPLDVLLLMDEPAFAGCLVPGRLAGVIEAEQTEADGRTVRNDRIIAVAQQAPSYCDIHSLKDINEHLLKELEHFFVSYHALDGSRFRIRGVRGPKQAKRYVERGRQQAKERKAR